MWVVTSAISILRKNMIAKIKDTPNKCKWFSIILLYLVLVLNASTNACATTNFHIEKENYKLYTHIKLTNHNEYLCLEKLWTLESQWNPKSKNKKSSAYGIPQLLNLKTKDPYKQIDAGLKYIAHRYGTPCRALAHHLKVGHY